MARVFIKNGELHRPTIFPNGITTGGGDSGHPVGVIDDEMWYNVDGRTDRFVIPVPHYTFLTSIRYQPDAGTSPPTTGTYSIGDDQGVGTIWPSQPANEPDWGLSPHKCGFVSGNEVIVTHTGMDGDYWINITTTKSKLSGLENNFAGGVASTAGGAPARAMRRQRFSFTLDPENTSITIPMPYNHSMRVLTWMRPRPEEATPAVNGKIWAGWKPRGGTFDPYYYFKVDSTRNDLAYSDYRRVADTDAWWLPQVEGEITFSVTDIDGACIFYIDYDVILKRT